VTPSPLTSANDELAHVAAELRGCSISIEDFAERACAWSRHALTYEYGITSVRTTATAALGGGRGYVRTSPRDARDLPSRERPCVLRLGHLVGEGGSHAWWRC